MTRQVASGFTLIEVTVALALTALIALLLAGALTGSADTMFRLERHQERTEETRDADHFLRRVIHAAPPVGMFRRGRLELFFEGTADRLSVPMETARGLLMVVVGVDNDRLVLREALPPAFADDSRASAFAEVVLLAGVRRLDLAYYDGRTWLREWPHRERLPLAVRIGLTMADGSQRHARIIDLALATPL